MRLSSDLTAFYRFLKVGSRGAGNEFSLVTSDRTQGNGMKLLQGKFRLDMRECLVTGTGSPRKWCSPKPVRVQGASAQCS